MTLPACFSGDGRLNEKGLVCMYAGVSDPVCFSLFFILLNRCSFLEYLRLTANLCVVTGLVWCRGPSFFLKFI